MHHNLSHTNAIALGCLLGLILLSQAQTADAISQSAAEGAEISIEHGKINTADASPVDPGHFEIEPSFSFTRATRSWDAGGQTHDRGLLREQSMGLSFTAGLVADADINISAGYSWLKDNDNDFNGDDGLIGPSRGHDPADLEVSGRYRFYADEESHLEMAYIGGVTIPAGSSPDAHEIGTSQEYWSFNQTLVATKDWGQWTLNGDIGHALPIGNKREHSRGTLNADLALGYQVLPWLQPEVELNYSRDLIADEADAQALAVTAGLVMPLNETLRINLGVQHTLWGENADKATTILTAIKFAF